MRAPSWAGGASHPPRTDAEASVIELRASESDRSSVDLSAPIPPNTATTPSSPIVFEASVRRTARTVPRRAAPTSAAPSGPSELSCSHSVRGRTAARTSGRPQSASAAAVSRCELQLSRGMLPTLAGAAAASAAAAPPGRAGGAARRPRALRLGGESHRLELKLAPDARSRYEVVSTTPSSVLRIDREEFATRHLRVLQPRRARRPRPALAVALAFRLIIVLALLLAARRRVGVGVGVRRSVGAVDGEGSALESPHLHPARRLAALRRLHL